MAARFASALEHGDPIPEPTAPPPPLRLTGLEELSERRAGTSARESASSDPPRHVENRRTPVPPAVHSSSCPPFVPITRSVWALCRAPAGQVVRARAWSSAI